MEKNNNSKLAIDFNNPKEIKEFISKNESSIYTGTNIDGQEVIVKLQQNEGMIVETLNNKGWWEWNEYDETGFVVGQGVSPSSELESLEK